MNKKNWRKPHGITVWLGKLTEEVGEVGQELAKHEIPLVSDYERAIEELKHVEFIAKNFRLDLERRIS
jgi:NTP pyrophosphatase (non-canonical NTP hydrolase)